MTLVQRLNSLKVRYARLKRQHREREPIHREMVFLMCKILRRETAQERRENAGN